MGGYCNCFNLKNHSDINVEMLNGILPITDKRKNLDNKELNEKNDDFDIFFDDDNNNVSNVEENRNDEIYDFFNDLRANPQNYLNQAQKYDLYDIIAAAKERVNENNIDKLIKTSFMSLRFDEFVHKTPFSKSKILKNIENDIIIQKYNKKLYIVESSSDNPIECVWNLLKENRNIALNEILYNNPDYFVISTYYLKDENKIRAYFLFLKKNRRKQNNLN